MFPLSVAIIAKNEADRIGDAIRSVQPLAAEVVVVESGSSDETVSVAQSLGARVIETDWPGHVAQKNRAIEACEHDWVLSIDADERLSPELLASVEQQLVCKTRKDAYRCARLSWWGGAPLRYGTWYPDTRIRLFDRRRARWAGDNPHDFVEVDGSIGDLSGDLLHHPYRDLSEHLQTIDRYTRIAADAAREQGRSASWADVALRPPLHLAKALLLKRGLLDGPRGVCVAGLGATYVLLKWGRIWLDGEQP